MNKKVTHVIGISIILTLILSMFFFVEDFKINLGKKNAHFYNTKEYIVNISSNPQRFFKLKMNFEVDNKNVLKEIDKKQPIIEDAIIIYLSTLTPSLLEKQETKQIIKEELIQRINSNLSKGSIKGIYYENFVWN